MLPYEVAKETLGEKYVMLYSQILHVGAMNGLCGWRPGSVGISLTFRAKAKGSSSCRAVKMVRKERVVFPKLLQRQYTDFTAMEHPHLCRLWDAFEDAQNLYFVFDHLAGPSLLEQALDDPHFCERDAGAAGKGLLQALAHLHRQHIVHLNVRPENLRFMNAPKRKGWGSGYQDSLKLMDFGHCMHIKYLSSVVLHSGAEDACLPPFPALGTDSHLCSSWCPPEHRGKDGAGPFFMTFQDLMAKCVVRRSSSGVLPGTPRSHQASWSCISLSQESTATSFSRSSSNWTSVQEVKRAFKVLEAGDVWSAGCVIHLLLAGAPPDGEGVNGSDMPTLPPKLSLPARGLCAALLQQFPGRRPTAADAVDCSWFKQVDWFQKAHRSEIRSDMRTPELRQDHHAMLRPMGSEAKAQLALHHRAVQVRRALLRMRALLAAPEADLRREEASTATTPGGGAVPGVAEPLAGADVLDGPALSSRCTPQRQTSGSRLHGDRVPDRSAEALLPVPPVVDGLVPPPVTSGQAVEAICHDAFRSVVLASQSKRHAKVLTVAELQAVVASVGELPGQGPTGVLRRLSPSWRGGNVTEENFFDLLTECVATKLARRRRSPSVAAGQRLARRNVGRSPDSRRTG